MIAVPHLGPSAVQVSPQGVQVATTVPADDPGDPFLQGQRAHTADESAAEKPAATTSLVTIRFKNALDKTMSLVNATFILDGQPLPVTTDLSPQGDSVIYTGRLVPGAHAISTRLACRGTKRGGVFTYTQGYNLDVSSQKTLDVPENSSVVFTISAVRRKGMNVPIGNQVDISLSNQVQPEPVSQRP
jgi:hypothetical protein